LLWLRLFTKTNIFIKNNITMAVLKPKKPFKLNVLGLFKWESEDWTVNEIALILTMVMAFTLLMVIILKLYVIPAIGTPTVINKATTLIQKITKSRSP
jgi:hypothetical protein